MRIYLRNSLVSILFCGEDLIVKGGRYGKTIKATPILVYLLKKTATKISEQELVEALKNKFGIQSDKAMTLVNKLYDLGFIERDILFHLEQIQQQKASSRTIATINFPTYERLIELNECMESYMKNFQMHQHELDYYIFDDTMQDRKVHKDLKCSNGTIYYIGFKEKQKLVELLAKQFDKNLVTFAFLPNALIEGKRIFQAGANRNCILAYNAGNLFLMADDDSYCKGIEHDTANKLMFSVGRGNLNKEKIDDVTLTQCVKTLECDVYKLHERFLGRTLEEVLATYNLSDITCDMVDGQNDIFPNKYNMYRHSKINFTFNEMVGWPDQTADEALLEGLAHQDMGYILGMKNQMIKESLLANSIYTTPHLLTTTLTGMDGLEASCPFVPLYRNEDIHFSYVLNYLNPFTLAAGVQTNLLHYKNGTSHQLSSFYKNFYGDIVFSYVLFNVLNRLKLDVSNKYLSIEMRKTILAHHIKLVCGNNQKELVSNLLDLKIDLEKVYLEKRQIVMNVKQVFHLSEVMCNELGGDNTLNSYEHFLNSKEWEGIRKILLLYGELLVCWSDMLQLCMQLRMKDKLPKQLLK